MNAHQKNAYYKYRPLYQYGGTGREAHPFTQSLIKDAQIYYSAPRDFNDPFDCNLKLHVRDSSDAEWEAYCDRIIGQFSDPEGKVAVVKAEKRWQTDPRISETIGVDTLKNNYEQSSVFCLSKKSNSIPMFSYYADCHKGIAVEFCFSDLEIPCGIPLEEVNQRGVPYGGKMIPADVKYPSIYPELNYHRLYDTPALVENLIFTKHHEWAHEQEFRIFRRRVPASVVKFNKRLLTRVIFGCNTIHEDVELAKTWLVDWPSDVVLSRAEKATDKFELQVTDFDSVKGTNAP